MSPSSTYDLHAEHRPSRQPCIRWMPCRKAASRMFSSSPTSISMSTGSKLMRCVSATKISSGSQGLRRYRWMAPRAGSQRHQPMCASGRDGAGAVRRDVGLALLVGHLVEQHVGAVERVAADVVEGPQLLRV